MTRIARGREAGSNMVGGLRPGVLGPVTAHAIARRAPVDVVLVARRAGLRRVDPDQLKDRRVVETTAAAVLPHRITGPVTRVARDRKTGRCMRGRLRRVVVLAMTRDAGHRASPHIGRFVARLAGEPAMVGVEVHAGHPRMVPANRGPRRRAMARLALRAEPRLKTIVLPADPVTLVTGVWRADVLVLDVALGARDRQMPALEPEARGVVKRPVRRVELRVRGRADEQGQQRSGRDEKGAAGLHNRWQSLQLGPSAPRCLST